MKNLNRRNFISQLSRAVFLAGTVPAMLSGCASQAAEKKRGFKLGSCDWSMGKGCAGSVKAFDVCKEVGLDGVQISQPFKKDNPVFCPPEKLAEYKAAMARTARLAPPPRRCSIRIHSILPKTQCRMCVRR